MTLTWLKELLNSSSWKDVENMTVICHFCLFDVFIGGSLCCPVVQQITREKAVSRSTPSGENQNKWENIQWWFFTTMLLPWKCRPACCWRTTWLLSIKRERFCCLECWWAVTCLHILMLLWKTSHIHPVIFWRHKFKCKYKILAYLDARKVERHFSPSNSNAGRKYRGWSSFAARPCCTLWNGMRSLRINYDTL